MPSLTHFYVAVDFIGIDEFNPMSLISVETSSQLDAGFNQRFQSESDLDKLMDFEENRIDHSNLSHGAF